MPELKTTSASQVETFNQCQRLWYFKSILKLTTPQTEAQARGSAIHKTIENFLALGEVQPESEVFRPHLNAIAEYLPPPKADGVWIEKRIEFGTYEGGPLWVGYIDLLEYKRDPILISDYKSTSDFRYMKTASELMLNTQLNAYSQNLLKLTLPIF